MNGINLWDVCEECGSSKLTFVNEMAEQGSSGFLTFVECEECGETWEDFYKEIWETSNG